MDYIAKNRACWNMRTAHHVGSAFYDMEGFRAGQTSLKPIELALLGDVAGKSILHLQCHFGQDSLSLARMGAQVTGVDLSDAAIAQAQELTLELGLEARFICCDLYDLPQHVEEKFDIVFTSYGTIGWLPDLDRWAAIIALYLKPTGKFVFTEFHPVVWMYDNDFTHVAYSYFKANPILETESGTYADTEADIVTESITWNHSIAEVLTALLAQGLHLSAFQEFNYSPYNCFRHTETLEEGKYSIKPLGPNVPLVYALVAEL
jgi:2-polyprenyl-3-methyl-5-hydroxy-6-metoxy-1,4-benzoquinol methylase